VKAVRVHEDEKDPSLDALHDLDAGNVRGRAILVP
jgi:hypothetical protein